MMGEHVPVSSSNIKSVAYDPDRQTLEVLFTSGRAYRYNSVPAALVEKLKSATSPGAFFARHIRTTYQGFAV